MHGRTWKRLVPLVLAAALLATTRPAMAWNGKTHRELARQSILWMLRSSNRVVRLAGIAIVSAGEGYTTTPTGERNWLLSKEAQFVDIYRDVMLRNKGDTPSEIIPPLAYDLNGEGFTKYNHFILANQTTTGNSLETFPITVPLHPQPNSKPLLLLTNQKENPWLDEVFTDLGHTNVSYQGKTCIEIIRQVGGYTGDDNGGPKDYSEYQDSRGNYYCDLKLRRIMDQHENLLAPGYVQGIDPTLQATWDEDKTKAALRMVGSDEFQNFCEEQIGSVVAGNFDTTTALTLAGTFAFGWKGTFAGAIVGGIIKNIPGFSQALDWLAKNTVGEVVGNLVANYLAKMCPWAVGVWVNDDPATYLEKFTFRQWDGRRVNPSLALIRQASMNQNTLKPDHVQDVWLGDVRWNGVDDIASWGTVSFLDYDAAIDQSIDYLREMGDIGKDARKRTEELLHARPSYLTTNSNWTTEPITNHPFYQVTGSSTPIGQLLHLGQLLHAMSDLAVAGHTTGHLLGPEHIALENAVDTIDVKMFDFEGTETGTGSREYVVNDASGNPTKTGSLDIHPSIQGEGVTWELDAWIDTDVAETQIIKALSPILPNTTSEQIIEKLAEDASKLTKFEAGLNAPMLEAPVTEGTLRREFATRALVNNVVALTRAMQLYYRKHSDYSLDYISKYVTWTPKDVQILRAYSQFREGRYVVPTFGETLESSLAKNEATTYNLYVDRHYQEYKVEGCFVRSHNWCSVALGYPCPSQESGVTFCTGTNDSPDCWRSNGPELMDASDVKGQVTLSAANMGGDDEFVHVTGVFTMDPNYPAPKEHFLGQLTSTAGRIVPLPRGALASGVALWCTGPRRRQRLG